LVADRAAPAGGAADAGLVHRLDCETSGCLVIARSAEAHADLTRRLRESAGVRKIYLARCRTGLDDDGAATFYFSSRHKGSAR
jgi:23S rRNA-/tRNA-specific pseudouridylate synthase